MPPKPLVSVITTFLNEEKFIEQAIASVFAQTYENWELLLVDDGSSDDSTVIARRYAKNYPEKVRYLEHDGHQNRGASASRNLGICHGRGEYIAFLDADDVWLPHKLEQQVEILETHPEADMVCGATQYWNSWTGISEDVQSDVTLTVGAPLDTLIQPPTLLTLLYPLGQGTAPSLSNLLLQRKIVESVGRFQEDFRGIYQLYEDQAFLTKVYLKARVFVVSVYWDRYRQHPDSCVSSVKRSGQYHTVRRFFLNWFEEYLCGQGAKETEVWQALQKALWPYRHPLLSRLVKFHRRPFRQMKALMKWFLRRILPASIHHWFCTQLQSYSHIK
ncbi:glycosyltransferase family 2 protein [candidate division KSB1 bacterium]|nr:glycosyltransferase family 2 protein [candidate division KSB1 bacterium]